MTYEEFADELERWGEEIREYRPLSDKIDPDDVVLETIAHLLSEIRASW
jgi:hypothetical protein